MITLASLGWFAPPELSRPDLQSRARALWVVSWPFFVVVALVLGVAVLVEPQTLGRRAVTIASVGALITLLHTLSRAGRPVLASWILVIGLSLIVTQRAWITGGIHAPVPVFYALFIVMGSVLIGSRGGLVTALVCFLGAVLLTVGTASHWLTPRPGAGSVLGAFVFVVLAIGLALVLQALLALRARVEARSLNAMQMFVHDMRSPMQTVLAHLALLRENIHGEEVKDVEGAIGGATVLHRMSTNLLDVGRLEAGRMPVQRSPTDLLALAQSVVNAVRILQPARDLAVLAQGDTLCRCDGELTRRIIENLVSNSMKHTPIEGRIRVTIAGSPERVSIAVSDEGPGVPPEQRQRIFEPYGAEGLKSATGYESWGLGLAFSRLAAEAQGGSIRIENAAPRGSRFVVELPR